MSNPDSFINEVTEEVRRERLFGYMRRYGWIVVLLILLIVAGAAWNEWRKAQERAEAQVFGDVLLTALAQEDPAARYEALQSVQATGARAGVLRLLAADQALAADDRATALAELDAVANDATLSSPYRQLALLKQVTLAGADMPAAERLSALQGLAQPGQPYRPLAMEQLALLRIEAGEPETAVPLLREILAEAGVTQSLRQRASQLIVVLGETPDAAG